MGGYGSSRWRNHRKAPTIEMSLVLDSTIFSGRDLESIDLGVVRVRAAHCTWSTDLDYELVFGFQGPVLLTGVTVLGREFGGRIYLESASTPFGGQRTYFRCPVIRGGAICGARMAKLYMPLDGASYFGCRQCHGLVYASSQWHKTALERLLRRVPSPRSRTLAGSWYRRP